MKPFDLTKLREVFDEWTHKHMKHDSRITDGVRVPIMSRKELDELEYKLWCALTEVLDAETSNRHWDKNKTTAEIAVESCALWQAIKASVEPEIKNKEEDLDEI